MCWTNTYLSKKYIVVKNCVDKICVVDKKRIWKISMRVNERDWEKVWVARGLLHQKQQPSIWGPAFHQFLRK